MVVISAGLEKSGTAWLFNLTNDLLQRGRGSDARETRRQFGLEDLLNPNCNIGLLSWRNLGRLWRPVIRGRTFVVKTHFGPTPAVRALTAARAVRSTYVYRDPRDVVVSILDHGRKLREEGRLDVEFARFHSVQDAAGFVATRLPIWEAWTRFPGTFVTRYEDLVGNGLAVLRALSAFLGVSAASGDLEEILSGYGSDRARSDPDLHFNVGKAGRYREVLGPCDRAWCEEFLAPMLSRMGYA